MKNTKTSIRVGDLVRTSWDWATENKTGILVEHHPDWQYSYIVYHSDGDTCYYQLASLEKIEDL